VRGHESTNPNVRESAPPLSWTRGASRHATPRNARFAISFEADSEARSGSHRLDERARTLEARASPRRQARSQAARVEHSASSCTSSLRHSRSCSRSHALRERKNVPAHLIALVSHFAASQLRPLRPLRHSVGTRTAAASQSRASHCSTQGRSLCTTRPPLQSFAGAQHAPPCTVHALRSRRSPTRHVDEASARSRCRHLTTSPPARAPGERTPTETATGVSGSTGGASHSR